MNTIHKYKINSGGYIALIAVLVMGGVMLTAGLSASRSGIASARGAGGAEYSARALALADACVEEALFRLRGDVSYVGNEMVSVNPSEYCTIGDVGGTGATDRTITAFAEVGGYTRNVEVFVETLTPSVKTQYWRQVSAFSL